LAWMASASPG